MHAEKLHKEDQLESRIESFEMAFKMQTEATDAFDIRKETEAVRKAYAANTQQGRQMLIARRLLTASSDARTMTVFPSAEASASTPGGSSSVCRILVTPAVPGLAWLLGRPCGAAGGGLVM